MRARLLVMRACLCRSPSDPRELGRHKKKQGPASVHTTQNTHRRWRGCGGCWCAVGCGGQKGKKTSCGVNFIVLDLNFGAESHIGLAGNLLYATLGRYVGVCSLNGFVWVEAASWNVPALLALDLRMGADADMDRRSVRGRHRSFICPPMASGGWRACATRRSHDIRWTVRDTDTTWVH